MKKIDLDKLFKAKIPEKLFMIDIESTGVEARDAILEIGILESVFKEGHFVPGKTFRFIQHWPEDPKTVFAKKHMAKLYKECNEAPVTPPNEVREKILGFFSFCGVESVTYDFDPQTHHYAPNVIMLGKCIGSFDLQFLIKERYLIRSYYIKHPHKDEEVQGGDFHYRDFEMSGIVQLLQYATGVPSKVINLIAPLFDDVVEIPKGYEHDAIFDCYKQLKELNGYLAITRSPNMFQALELAKEKYRKMVENKDN